MKKYFAQMTSSKGGRWFTAEAESKKRFREVAKRIADEENLNLAFIGEGEPPTKDTETVIHDI